MSGAPSENQMAPEKHAFLIGPSYASFVKPPLEGVGNDLHIMKGMLMRNGFFSQNIKVLMGAEASRENILKFLAEFSSRMDRRSIVVIYFSGHGYEFVEFDPQKSGQKHFDQGIVPADQNETEFNKGFVRGNAVITGDHLKPYFSELIEKDCAVITIFDCCFSGRMYRGFSTGNSSAKTVRKLTFPKDLLQSKTRGPGEPVEHEEEPMEQCQQETHCPDPMHSYSQLNYPVQEFWTPVWSALDSPQSDRLISIAASSSVEEAWEFQDPETNKWYGRLTYALVEVIDEMQNAGKKMSYNMLKRRIKLMFTEKGWDQNPQFEGICMDMELFGFQNIKGSQPKSFEISEVMVENGFVKVILNAGKLHGVVDGQYNVYKPHITEEQAKLYRCIDTIDVTVNDIDMLKSRGAAMYKRDAGGLKVGCKAILSSHHSMCTPVYVKWPAFPMDQECHDQMSLVIENQGMFSLEREERPHSVTLDVQQVEGKNCWRACQFGRMIVPYQESGDEYLMLKNLAKYFRHKFAIGRKWTNDRMLKNVSFKVFKVENVPSFKGSPGKKNELINEAIKTGDLYSGESSQHEVPTFRAHQVELKNAMYGYWKKYQVIDGSGDAIVIEITNNETIPIYVCAMSYQADGSIVVLHPHRDGQTEVLREGESMKTIKRVLLEPETARRMAEPDFDKPRPEYCDDVLILYATSEPSDFSPLIQTAIELSPKLSTRGPNPPDGFRLTFANNFRDALRPPRSGRQGQKESSKWLTLRRDIRIFYNENQKH